MIYLIFAVGCALSWFLGARFGLRRGALLAEIGTAKVLSEMPVEHALSFRQALTKLLAGR